MGKATFYETLQFIKREKFLDKSVYTMEWPWNLPIHCLHNLLIGFKHNNNIRNYGVTETKCIALLFKAYSEERKRWKSNYQIPLKILYLVDPSAHLIIILPPQQSWSKFQWRSNVYFIHIIVDLVCSISPHH